MITKKLSFADLGISEKKDIDEVISRSSYSTIYHTVEWNMALNSFLRKREVILLMYDADKPIGFFIFYKVPKFFLFNICKTNLIESPYSGPLASDNNSEVIGLLIKEQEKFGRGLIHYIGTYPGWHYEFPKEAGYLTKGPGKTVSVLKLSNDIDEQFKRFDKNKRWDIKKAINSGVELVEGGINELDTYYGMLIKTTQRLGIRAHPKKLYEAVLTKLPDGMAQMLLARYQGQIISGTIILKWRNSAFYWNSVSTGEYRDVQSTSFLVWEATKILLREGYQIFDLHGMDIPPVRHFKKSFKGETRLYREYVKKSRIWNIIRLSMFRGI